MIATSTTRTSQRKASDEHQFVESLRSKSARKLTLAECTKAAEIARTKPAIDHEVNFDFNKDTVSKGGLACFNPAAAVRDPAFNDSIVLLGGHTDAKNSAEYNQGSRSAVRRR